MRDPLPDDAMDGPIFAPDTIIRTALHAAAATDKPIRVMADGQVLGVVDRARILESIAGAEEPEPEPAREAPPA
jgi:glycine betaine/proline transport system ATP-binding protein